MSNPDPLYPSSSAKISPTHHDALATYDGPNANLVQSNKAAVFATLVATDITQVVVNFDGYGDEGQIGEIEARSGDHIVELPDTIVALTFARWGQSDPAPHLLPLHKAIEHLAYHYLGQTHDGWQDGEGAYGEFVFDVATGSITLDHNERFVDYETYSHVF